MKVRLYGDVHGHLLLLGKLMQQFDDEVDYHIQVGDFGFGFGLSDAAAINEIKHFANQYPRLYWIDGNHDNHFLLHQPHVLRELNKLEWKYVQRATRWESPSIGFMGGATSIDRHARTNGIDWWPEEIPSYSEFEDFVNMKPVSLVVTHDAPSEVIARAFHVYDSDSVRDTFQTAFEYWNWKPDYWVFGHWHKEIPDHTATGKINGVNYISVNETRFICLPPIAAPQNLEYSDGLTLDIK